MGSWASYGLGNENADLPAFVAMTSRGKRGGQPLYDRLWGSGFLPTTHQGVKFRDGGDPVLYLNNPPGVSPDTKRAMLDDLGALNSKRLELVGDPEIATRIAQYELAYRMQTSVPRADGHLGTEPEERPSKLYGPRRRRSRGTYASQLHPRPPAGRARRALRAALFHMGWDQHGGLPERDQAAVPEHRPGRPRPLINDLEQRGMLDDTLVVWGGEFGRTNYSQGKPEAPTTTAATTTRGASPSGWPAAASNPG